MTPAILDLCFNEEVSHYQSLGDSLLNGFYCVLMVTTPMYYSHRFHKPVSLWSLFPGTFENFSFDLSIFSACVYSVFPSLNLIGTCISSLDPLAQNKMSQALFLWFSCPHSFKKNCVYLAACSLSWGRQDLCSIMWDLLLQCIESRAHRVSSWVWLNCCAAELGSLVSWPGDQIHVPYIATWILNTGSPGKFPCPHFLFTFSGIKNLCHALLERTFSS